MGFPRSFDPGGITPKAGTDKFWRIPLSPERRIIRLVVINRTDVNVYMYHVDSSLDEAVMIPMYQGRRYEFRREESWSALEGWIHVDQDPTNGRKVYIEVEEK